MKEELADRFGALPPEVEQLLTGAALRILGKRLGVERVLVRGNEARVNFRNGVVPRLTALEGPLKDHEVDVEVRRLHPLSLAVRQLGTEPVVETLILVLRALLSERARAV